MPRGCAHAGDLPVAADPTTEGSTEVDTCQQVVNGTGAGARADARVAHRQLRSSPARALLRPPRSTQHEQRNDRMRNRTRGSLVLAILMLGACASPPRSTLRGADPTPAPVEAPPPPSPTASAPAPVSPPAVAPTATSEVGREVVRVARGYLGAPYRFAGRGPASFDCSGLVQRSFEAVGVRVPRTSAEQARFGRAVRPDAMRPGDLVLFADARGAINHVGIFSGRGRFVHASSSRGVVEDALDASWFRARFVGARRVVGH